jgi:hypothetical protein
MNIPDDWEHNECPKCVNTSGKVTWTEKKYEGPKWDGQAHQIEYKIQTALESEKRKKLW